MPSRFDTTHWSLVLASREPSEEARSALEQLCSAYWLPLYAFLRRRGYRPEDAEDLLQGYFLRLLEKGYLQDVDPEKGRFRAFLLASLKNFVGERHKHARAQKRGAGRAPLSLDVELAEGFVRGEPEDDLTPERVFERRWAQTVVRRALDRLEAEYGTPDAPVPFSLLRPLLVGGDSTSYAEIAALAGTTPGALKVRVHRLRQRFGRVLRREVRTTVRSDDQVDAEVRALLAALGEGGGLEMGARSREKHESEAG